MTLELSHFVEQDRGVHRGGQPQRAVTFLRGIRSKFAEVHRTPLLYRLRPEIGSDARLVPFGNYVILFRLQGDRVRIERVVYGGRLLADVFDEGSQGR